MRTKLFLLLFLVTSVWSCKKFDDSHLWDSINSLNARVERLEDVCDRMNTNISSLQIIVQALENNDAVTSVSSLPNASGYTITFASGKVINIYNGTDGKDGEDGKDGQNGVDGQDGKTPIISVRKDVNGAYYWTVDGEWLIVDGQKVKAVGEDGSDGQDGIDGEDGAPGNDGTDGITPQFKIEDGYWYISYNNKQSWEQVGKATGEDGISAETFFKRVSIENGFVYFILNDTEQTEIRLPFASEKALMVNVETAGTLEDCIDEEQARTVTALKITGNINEADMRFINMYMLVLEVLDLSETNYTVSSDNTFFYLNPCGERLPNRTIRRVITPLTLTGLDGYRVHIFDCIGLKSLIISSTTSLESSYRVSTTQRQLWNHQLDSLIIPIGATKISIALNIAANIVLPETMSNVSVFYSATGITDKNIKSIVCKAIVPPTTTSTGVADAILYVPAVSVDLYKKATGWKDFQTILPIEEE